MTDLSIDAARVLVGLVTFYGIVWEIARIVGDWALRRGGAPELPYHD